MTKPVWLDLFSPVPGKPTGQSVPSLHRPVCALPTGNGTLSDCLATKYAPLRHKRAKLYIRVKYRDFLTGTKSDARKSNTLVLYVCVCADTRKQPQLVPGNRRTPRTGSRTLRRVRRRLLSPASLFWQRPPLRPPFRPPPWPWLRAWQSLPAPRQAPA